MALVTISNDELAHLLDTAEMRARVSGVRRGIGERTFSMNFRFPTADDSDLERTIPSTFRPEKLTITFTPVRISLSIKSGTK